MFKIYNYIIFLLVACTSFGNIGGAFQIERILTILFFPWLIIRYREKGCAYSKTLIKVLACCYLYMLMSYIWTPDNDEGIKEIVYYPIHFILFLELIVFARYAPFTLKSVSRGWLVAVLLCSIVAYWEITTGQHLSIAKEQKDMMNIEGYVMQHFTASVTFFNYNSYVTYLCFSFPWIFYILIDKGRSFIEQILALLALVMASMVIVINASRGGVLSIVTMLMVYYWYSEKSQIKNVTLLVVVTLLIYGLIQYGEEFTALFIARASDGGMFTDDARSVIWSNALLAFCDSFGFGVGIGGLSASMAEYAHGGITVTHNMFLEILVQYGVVILLVFLYFLLGLFRKSLRVERKRKIVIMMSLVAMPVYSIIDSGYLLNTHFFVLIASIYIFANYELIKCPNNRIRQTA